MKIIYKDNDFSDLSKLKDVLTEVHIIANFNHPNVIKLVEYN
jgi:hypothetical protein